MAVPDNEPYLIVLDEPTGEDQSMGPSVATIRRRDRQDGLPRGFPHVYRFRELPDHEITVRESAARARTMVAASTMPLNRRY